VRLDVDFGSALTCGVSGSTHVEIVCVSYHATQGLRDEPDRYRSSRAACRDEDNKRDGAAGRSLCQRQVVKNGSC